MPTSQSSEPQIVPFVRKDGVPTCNDRECPQLADMPHWLLRWWHRVVLTRWGRGRWRVFRAAVIVFAGERS